MKKGLCSQCGVGLESGRDFTPIDPKGTPNRRWVCSQCRDKLRNGKQTRN